MPSGYCHGFCGKGKNTRQIRGRNRKSCPLPSCTFRVAFVMPFAEKAKAPPKAILALYGKDFEGRHSTLIVKAPGPSAGAPSIDGKYRPCPMSWPAMLFRRIGFPTFRGTLPIFRYGRKLPKAFWPLGTARPIDIDGGANPTSGEPCL